MECIRGRSHSAMSRSPRYLWKSRRRLNRRTPTSSGSSGLLSEPHPGAAAVLGDKDHPRGLQSHSDWRRYCRVAQLSMSARISPALHPSVLLFRVHLSTEKSSETLSETASQLRCL